MPRIHARIPLVIVTTFLTSGCDFLDVPTEPGRIITTTADSTLPSVHVVPPTPGTYILTAYHRIDSLVNGQVDRYDLTDAMRNRARLTLEVGDTHDGTLTAGQDGDHVFDTFVWWQRFQGVTVQWEEPVGVLMNDGVTARYTIDVCETACPTGAALHVRTAPTNTGWPQWLAQFEFVAFNDGTLEGWALDDTSTTITLTLEQS